MIAGLLFMAGMRRSEVSALRWSDMVDATDGVGVLVTVRRSKTNQDGETNDVRFVKDGVARALRTLRTVTSPAPGDRVVPLSAQMVGLRFTAAAHSGRGAGNWKTSRMDDPTRPLRAAPSPPVYNRIDNRASRTKDRFTLGPRRVGCRSPHEAQGGAGVPETEDDPVQETTIEIIANTLLTIMSGCWS